MRIPQWFITLVCLIFVFLIMASAQEVFGQTYSLAPEGYQTLLDSTGTPMSGGKVFSYLTGTSSASPTYATSTGTANGNILCTIVSTCVVADSAGRVVIYMSSANCLKFVVTTSADVIVRTLDPICPLALAGTVSAISAAPFITRTTSTALSNETSMGGLGTGLVYNTATTGVPSIVTAGTGITISGGLISVTSGGTSGLIAGSTGSTDNAILRADGTGGATIQNSPIVITDAGNITISGLVTMTVATTPGTIAIVQASTPGTFATLQTGHTEFQYTSTGQAFSQPFTVIKSLSPGELGGTPPLIRIADVGDTVTFGLNAGNSLILGNERNTYLGTEAGRDDQQGTYNACLGYRACADTVDESYTTAIGAKSGEHSDGSYNLFAGHGSAFRVTGDANVYLGESAAANSVSTGNNNVGIGEGTMQAITTGSNNTVVGQGAGGMTTGSGNILLGYLATVSAGSSNILDIGNFLYGNLATKAIGIGTATPSYGLTVSISGATSGQTVFVQDATAVSGVTTIVDRAGAGQSTSNLQEWQSSASAVLLSVTGTGALFLAQQSAPAAPAAGNTVVYTKDAGGGKTTLCARFDSGAEQCFATEP